MTNTEVFLRSGLFFVALSTVYLLIMAALAKPGSGRWVLVFWAFCYITIPLYYSWRLVRKLNR